MENIKGKISIVDWAGIYMSGVTVNLSFTIFEESYNLMYWFNKEGKYYLDFDDKFKYKFNIKDITKMKSFKDLKNYIDFKVLPPKDEIWKEFNL